ncbi:hypothetical protein LB531_21770 [Mesorhizobium sp. CO1-1-2]|uniref:hypothetical protein n=1 Tax=Mesorhizobium sp. CO1-1-2 TaxID=2876635 RepID=UPI001CCB2BBB|nr:hypothetical protein [Mesorhizobium sp. CO1-1-2]MBZ9683290.1 hypothetical protein [Mesorhizobium sp. CO1-1-2]
MIWLIPIMLTVLVLLWLWRQRGSRDFDGVEHLELAICAILLTWLAFAIVLNAGWL